MGPLASSSCKRIDPFAPPVLMNPWRESTARHQFQILDFMNLSIINRCPCASLSGSPWTAASVNRSCSHFSRSSAFASWDKAWWDLSVARATWTWADCPLLARSVCSESMWLSHAQNVKLKKWWIGQESYFGLQSHDHYTAWLCSLASFFDKIQDLWNKLTLDSLWLPLDLPKNSPYNSPKTVHQKNKITEKKNKQNPKHLISPQKKSQDKYIWYSRISPQKVPQKSPNTVPPKNIL